jgi:hypothetical protein
METLRALHFIKAHDFVTLTQAIGEINAVRRQRMPYDTVVVTAPRRGWMALLPGRHVLADHLLLRNLSGRLSTRAFELQLGPLGFAYRLHAQGRTLSAFESNLPFYVNQRLRLLDSAQAVEILDLAEPIERFVLKRHQEQQHPGARIRTTLLDIPEELQTYYAGDAAALRLVLRSPVDQAYIARLLSPGFNPEAAFDNLVRLLDLPYLPPDEVLVSYPDGETTIAGYDITAPTTWNGHLPEGWKRIPAIA